MKLRTSIKKSHFKKKSSATCNTMKSTSQKSGNTGFCIRCGTQMELNPNKAICSKCYPRLESYSDKTGKTNYYHICGKESKHLLKNQFVILVLKKIV